VINKAELLKAVKDNDERMLYAGALDKAVAALKSYEAQFTAFTDPYKMGTLCGIVQREYSFGLNTMVWGGFDGAERCMLGFFPEYEEPTADKFPISCVKISYNTKFSRELSHRDFLGSILGLGISRDKTGDILIDNEAGCAYALMEREVAAFTVASLERVGHTKVNTAVLDSFAPAVKTGVEKRLTVTSLRLDAVLCGAFNLSRGRVADLIKGEKAFINWVCATSGAKTVAVGDALTLRGTGRVILKEVQGITKKDRVAIVIEVFK
jgi:RNA-binding protein YlmH